VPRRAHRDGADGEHGQGPGGLGAHVPRR
jgi:hypothetical protein